MVMSQGTSTFLACFAGFWLVWAVVVMFCCFCSFLQRRLKRRREERLRGRGPEMEPPPAPPQMPREPPQALVPHPLPQASWVRVPDSDLLGKPPCYEDAVLMEDPPPPYSEVLADPRGGTYLKPAPREPPSEPSKPPPASAPPDRGYSSLIRLPSSQRWDSLGHLLSNMDLNHNVTPPGGRSLHAARSFQGGAATATVPRREPRTHHDGLIQEQGGGQGFHRGIHGPRALESSCGLPTAFPLLGRSTAV